MPVALSNLREQLLPGLFAVQASYRAVPTQWAKVFAAEGALPVLPALSVPQAFAIGAAAAVITNPKVTRRGLLGWLT